MKLRQIAFIWLITLGLSVYAQNTVKSVEQVTDAVTLTDAVDYTITSANTRASVFFILVPPRIFCFSG